jgi:hypothetical protein
MAKTSMLIRGVNPTPPPDPQSFQKPMSGTCLIASRAPAIIVNAQSRALRDEKR